MYFIRQYSLFFIISILFYSCGLPDSSSVALDLNEPYIMKMVPGDKKIDITFVSQNSEPSFSGYNIYFGDNANPRQYKIYNEQREFPTIITNGSDNIREYTFTIEPGLYASKSGVEGTNELTDSDVPNGLPVYVWISSFQIAPERESSYFYNFYVETATPRNEVINATINLNDTISILAQGMATLVSIDGTLYFRNISDTLVQRRTATSLTDVNIPPTEGYTADDIEVLENRLYLIRKSSGTSFNYGKIFVRSIVGNSVIVDYALQTATDILSY